MSIVLIRQPIHDDLPDPISIGLDGLVKMAMNVLARSSNAQQTIRVVDGSTKQVGLLITATGVSQHIANDDALGLFNGGVAVVNINSPMTIGGETLPVVVTLIHELGHAKQLIENEGWYMTMFKNIVQAKLWGMANEYNTEKEKYANENPDVKQLMENGMIPNKNVLKPSVKKIVDQKKSLLQKEFEQLYGGAMQTLEMDNIRKHEHPVIRDLGFGPECCRQSYP